MAEKHEQGGEKSLLKRAVLVGLLGTLALKLFGKK